MLTYTLELEVAEDAPLRNTFENISLGNRLDLKDENQFCFISDCSTPRSCVVKQHITMKQGVSSAVLQVKEKLV